MEIGKTQLTSFLNDRLILGKVDFYTSVTRNKLLTGIEKKKKTKKAVEILKEDCQAFGTIAAKSLSLREAFAHPITTYPLNVADLEGSLRQADKASFRNTLIEEANASQRLIPEGASWLVDGMATIRSLKPKETYEDWITGFLKFITPSEVAHPAILEMVNDTYPKLSAKSGTRIHRGEEFQRTFVEGVGQEMPSGMAKTKSN